MSNDNETARENPIFDWCLIKGVELRQLRQCGDWFARCIKTETMTIQPTPDAALRALCEANGWDVPEFLNANKE